jgi:hypothetical protein
MAFQSSDGISVGIASLTGDLAVNGSNITTTNTTFTVANTTATTLSVGGAATSVLIGATTGNTVIRSSNTVLSGELFVNGGDIFSTSTTFTLANNTATTLEVGGAANVNIGSTSGNTVIRSANTVLTGDLFVNGGDIISTQTTFNVANTTATSVRVGGAATDLMLGAATGTTTIRNATVTLDGDLNVNGGDIGTNQTTFTVANTTATSVRIGGAATDLMLGASSGTLSIRNSSTALGGDLAVNGGDITTSAATFTVANTTATSVSVGGAATSVLIGAATGTATIRNANVVLDGNTAINGGGITTTNTIFTVANSTATTLSVGGAATSVLIGAATGTATIRNATVTLDGDLNVNGGDIATNQTTFTVANTTATSVSVGGAATSVLIGAATGTATIRNATTSLSGTLAVGNTSVSSNANRIDVLSDRTDGRIAIRTQNTAGAVIVESQVNNYWSGSTFIGTGIVQYDSAATGNTIAGLPVANLGALRFQNGSNALIYTNGSVPIVFGVTSTERMRIDTNGNLGIGNIPSGTYKLDVTGNIGTTGDLAVNGGDITTNTTTFTLANTTATTLELGGAANVNIGSTSGNTTIRSANTVLTGELFVNGGDIFTTATTFNVANTTATTLSVGGAATDLMLGATTGTATIRNANVVVTGTLTSRYATKVANTATATTLTPDVSANNQYSYTALATGLTINAPTGTPLDGERLTFRIKDNGTSRSLTWNAIYRIVGTVLPTATVASKINYVGCIYNSADTKWDVIAVAREA